MSVKKPKQRTHISAKDRVNRLFIAIAEHVLMAEEKFPGWPVDVIHGAAIMAEEAGEAVKAALQLVYEGGTVGAYRKELCHTAAMCVRALIDLDHHGVRRVKP